MSCQTGISASKPGLEETRGTIDWERDMPLIVKHMYILQQRS